MHSYNLKSLCLIATTVIGALSCGSGETNGFSKDPYSLLAFRPDRISASFIATEILRDGQPVTYYGVRLDATQDGYLGVQIESRSNTYLEPMVGTQLNIGQTSSLIQSWLFNLLGGMEVATANEILQRYQLVDGSMIIDQFEKSSEILSGRILEARWELSGQWRDPVPDGNLPLPELVRIQDITFDIEGFDPWINYCDPDCDDE